MFFANCYIVPLIFKDEIIRDFSDPATGAVIEEFRGFEMNSGDYAVSTSIQQSSYFDLVSALCDTFIIRDVEVSEIVPIPLPAPPE